MVWLYPHPAPSMVSSESQTPLHSRAERALAREHTLRPAVAQALAMVDEAHRAGRGVLHHSGTADQAADIERYGIEARQGDWVREVAHSATDEFDPLETSVPVAFFSEEPSWVMAQVSNRLRRMGASSRTVTVDSVREHGHLALVYADDAAFYRYHGEESEDPRVPMEPGVWVERLEDGHMVRLEMSELSEFDGLQCITKVPFGLEPGDIVTADPYVEPFANLTGDDLVEFLRVYAPERMRAIESATERRGRGL